MDSVTKNHQPPEVLRAMVVRAYGAGEAPSHEAGWFKEIGLGWFNAVYRIRLRSGRLVVLKIAPPAEVEVMTYEREAMATELAAVELIRTATTVPVPRIHHVDHDGDLCGADFFFMEHVDGDNLDVLRAELPSPAAARFDERLGDLTREINQVRGPAFGSLLGDRGRASVDGQDWRTAFTTTLEGVLGDGERRGVDLGVTYEGLRAAASAHAWALEEVVEPRLVQWDLWPGNCLVRGDEVVAVLDHERAFFGDPLMEFGFAGVESGAYGDTAAFLRGYGRAALAGSELVRRRLYDVHLAAVQVVETAYRCYPDSGPYQWARARLVEATAALC